MNSKKASNTYPGFVPYVKTHKNENIVLAISFTVIAIIIYYCYPYTDITPDTGGYLNWTYHNEAKPYEYGSPRPIGYSNFIGALKELSSGTGIIFLAQYIIHAIATWLFYFTVTYLLEFNNQKLRWVFLAVSILSATALYATNMIMSDSLFASLTVAFISLCMLQLHKPNYPLKGLTVLIMFAAISIRYIGLVYPVVLAITFLLGHKQKQLAAGVSGLVALLLFSYVQNIKSGTEEDMGVAVFSAFSGWQKANNALHIVPHLDHQQPLIETDDRELLAIDSLVRATYPYYDTLYAPPNEVTYNHIWHPYSSLMFAMGYFSQYSNSTDYHKNWTITGDKLYDYGSLLIGQHTSLYLKYYILNNAKRCFYAPTEVFEQFTNNNSTPVVANYFSWGKQKDIQPRSDILRPALKAAPIIYSLYWIAFTMASIYLFIMAWRKKMKPLQVQIALLLIGFVMIYTAASIYAAPINLRFLLPIRLTMLAIVFTALKQLMNNRFKIS